MPSCADSSSPLGSSGDGKKHETLTAQAEEPPASSRPPGSGACWPSANGGRGAGTKASRSGRRPRPARGPRSELLPGRSPRRRRSPARRRRAPVPGCAGGPTEAERLPRRSRSRGRGASGARFPGGERGPDRRDRSRARPRRDGPRADLGGARRPGARARGGGDGVPRRGPASTGDRRAPPPSGRGGRRTPGRGRGAGARDLLG